MNKQAKLILSIVLCVVLFAGVGLLYNNLKDKTDTNGGIQVTQSSQQSNENNNTNKQESTTQARQAAPDITVTDLNGNQHKLSDYKGKPVFLNFWATWCGPCKYEMPEFEKAYKQYGDQIEFLIVNVDGPDQASVNRASKFVSDNGYTFPVYYDTLNEGSMKYGVSSIPATYLIDANGNLVAHQIGAMTSEIVQTAMNMLLEG